MNTNTLGDRLRAARTYRGISQRALTDILRGNGIKISNRTVQKIETGYVKNTSYLVYLANALNVTSVWLRDGIGEMEILSTITNAHTENSGDFIVLRRLSVMEQRISDIELALCKEK